MQINSNYFGLRVFKRVKYFIFFFLVICTSQGRCSAEVEGVKEVSEPETIVYTKNEDSSTNLNTAENLNFNKFSIFGKRKYKKLVRQKRTEDFINLLNEISGDSDTPEKSTIEAYTPYEYEKPLGTKITRKNLAEGTNIKTGAANRLRIKELGLTRGTAHYTNPRVIENPNIYGPYLSAMLRDENLQELIMLREDELCEAFERAYIEENVLNSNPWFGKVKREKAKIIARKNEELKLYGRFLKVGENPNATLREKVIDIEARRRLGIEDFDEEVLARIDWDSDVDLDTVIREKLQVHPFFYKYLAPIYSDEDVEESSPEDFIRATDKNMTFRADDYNITLELNDELPFLNRYLNLTLDNLLHYGPTYGEVVNSLYILMLIRFFSLCIKYDPKSSFIISIIGFVSAYSYLKMFRAVLMCGYDTFPGTPNLFRLSSDVHLYTEFDESMKENAKSFYRTTNTKPDPYPMGGESPFYFVVKKVLFWLRCKIYENPSVHDFIQDYYYNRVPDFLIWDKIVPIYLKVNEFVYYYFQIIRRLINNDNIDNILQSIYLSQFLRSCRKYIPYPLYWHLGIIFIIQNQFFPKWKTCMLKLDQFIQLKLVPEMRYEEILTVEYIRSYVFMFAVYLIMLAMLHAACNQYYYLPFISEMVDSFFGKRSEFKTSKFLTKNPQFGGGDLSWQNQWEFMEARRGDFKFWYGLLGKPRKYILPKWVRIFNPIWWLKKLKGKK